MAYSQRTPIRPTWCAACFRPAQGREDVFRKTISEACAEALDDMQDAKFFAGKRWFDIRVIGAKQSIEVISTINSIVAVSKIMLPLILLGGLLLLIAIATKL